MQSVLIVEDHADTRAMLVQVAQEAFGEIDVTEAATLAQARRCLESNTFNIALLDISLPDGSGIELLADLAQQSPNTYAVMATIFDDDQHLFQALRAGASGYLLKDNSRQELVEQLSGILAGRPPLSPAISRRILRQFQQPVASEAQRNDLTPRETDILTMVAKGLTRGDIASALNISVNTVAEHIKNIYRKLQINSRSEATVEAMRRGLISP